VFLTLHKQNGREDEHDVCRGLLISDDIIVTSNKCSKFKFTFELQGWGTVKADPHTTLNSKKEMAESRLGFLEAHTPQYKHYLDIHVRRTSMFLSYRSNPAVNGTNPGAPVLMTCGEKKEPIAHNFPVDGEMVPLHELAGVVPDDILWEEIDIYTAPMLRYKTHHWWSKAVTLEEEDKAIRKLIWHYRGPPGSISIPEAHDSYVTKASHLFEAIDPRGHRYDYCFKRYFKRYRKEKPFSGMHFFDWLDFGKGKYLLEANSIKKEFSSKDDDEDCLKAEFNDEKVVYFDKTQQLKHEIYLTPSEDGTEVIARYKHNDELVPESDEDEPFLYMWGLDEKFYIIDDHDEKVYHKRGKVKHSTILAGQPGLSAGKAHFGRHGSLKGINWSSGHYRPDIQAAAMMYQWMKREGFNVTALNWIGRDSWSDATGECRDNDWNMINIDGYNNDELRRSCYEVVTSPTWKIKDED